MSLEYMTSSKHRFIESVQQAHSICSYIESLPYAHFTDIISIGRYSFEFKIFLDKEDVSATPNTIRLWVGYDTTDTTKKVKYTIGFQEPVVYPVSGGHTCEALEDVGNTIVNYIVMNNLHNK